MPDYKCKFCQMTHENEFDIYYGESDHWKCVGDPETGNPTIVYKKHYATELSDAIKQEAKMLGASLLIKYWKNISVDIKFYSYPHTHVIISEALNELPHKQ